METIQAREHSDKRKSAPVKTWRVLELADLKALRAGQRVNFLTRQGDVAQVKVTSVKTWKTRPGDIRLGLKYGMYEYSHVEYINGQYSSGEYLVAEVQDVISE